VTQEGCDQPVWVAPVVSYGASGEQQAFPGTCSIGTQALRVVIVELVRWSAPGPAGWCSSTGTVATWRPPGRGVTTPDGGPRGGLASVFGLGPRQQG